MHSVSRSGCTSVRTGSSNGISACCAGNDGVAASAGIPCVFAVRIANDIKYGMCSLANLRNTINGNGRRSVGGYLCLCGSRTTVLVGDGYAI